MYDPRLGYDPVHIPVRSRQVHADGTITIMCRICERGIIRQTFRGFSTAICAVCQGELERGKTPDEILADVHKREKQQQQELYNDIGPGGFKAEGITPRLKEIVQKVKQAAQRRKRGSLFSKKDKI